MGPWIEQVCCSEVIVLDLDLLGVEPENAIVEQRLVGFILEFVLILYAVHDTIIEVSFHQLRDQIIDRLSADFLLPDRRLIDVW